MKKKFPAYLEETAVLFDEIAVSAGLRGEQILLSPAALIACTGAREADLTL